MTTNKNIGNRQRHTLRVSRLYIVAKKRTLYHGIKKQVHLEI